MLEESKSAVMSAEKSAQLSSFQNKTLAEIESENDRVSSGEGQIVTLAPKTSRRRRQNRRKRRRSSTKKKLSGNRIFDLNRDRMRSFKPRPLHEAAAEAQGRAFLPNDFNLSRSYTKRIRNTRSSDDPTSLQFDPQSFRGHAREYFVSRLLQIQKLNFNSKLLL